LLTSRDVSMYLWAIRSFLYYAEIKCPVIVHDDGKLTAADYVALQESLPGIKIISRQEADSLIELKLKEFSKCLEYRKQNVLTLKMFDFNLLSKSEKILSFDSDILFFRQPAEIIQNINSGSSETIYNCEFNNPTYSTNATITESFPFVLTGFNSGLMCYVRENFQLAEIAEIVDWVYLHQESLSCLDEQVIYAILAERKLSRPLSSQYCADLQLKVRENKFVCRHYHTSLRYAFALEGLKELLRLKPKFLM
jgi:lipopolysaccharide biosynthesis glycosyltransferase